MTAAPRPANVAARPLGILWKFARIGERMSPYISLACVFMAARALSSPIGRLDLQLIICTDLDARRLLKDVKDGSLSPTFLALGVTSARNAVGTRRGQTESRWIRCGCADVLDQTERRILAFSAGVDRNSLKSPKPCLICHDCAHCVEEYQPSHDAGSSAAPWTGRCISPKSANRIPYLFQCPT